MRVISPFYFSPETEVREKVSARKLLSMTVWRSVFHENSIYREPVKKLPLNLWDFEGLLPSLQDPTTCPYPEQDRFQSVIFWMSDALNLLAPDFFFLILAHSVYKM